MDESRIIMADESHIVTALTQTESTVLHVAPERLWPLFKSLSFNQLTPSKVANVEVVSGSPGQVDSTFKIVYTDGAEWSIHILGVSDFHNSIIWEVVHAEPSTGFTSSINILRIFRVTSDNTSFVTWSTEYSSDAKYQVLADAKYKKLEAFAEIARTLAN
mmetsp:Transcript_3754/g.8012  ORF Transcript_3754/g.8012 Transcript_3754/m.8012 type:complete len:160 (-) Transcript_3754:39-518(-)